MLKLEKINWFTPGGVQIIKDLSLEIADGTLTVITGPNGGGKTTLAKLIAGIELPSSGKIYLDGEDITNADVTERAKMGVSFAFQQPVRFKGITVRKLIELSAGEKISEDKICAILGEVGLCAREYIDREVNATLSGGEIKRIEIATVLARHTRLTIFDEPEAGIDLWSFTNLIKVFDNLREKRNGTMVVISHQERILKTADNIAVISGGSVKVSGPSGIILPVLLNGKEISSACTVQEKLFN